MDNIDPLFLKQNELSDEEIAKLLLKVIRLYSEQCNEWSKVVLKFYSCMELIHKSMFRYSIPYMTIFILTIFLNL